MVELKWELIFINNDEFKSYLNILDFIELSKLSKLVRLKLKSKVFKNVVISDNIDDFIMQEFESSNIKTEYPIYSPSDLLVDEYTPLFNRSIQRFLPYIKKVNINEYSNHYQLLELSNLLPRLCNLSISDTILSLAVFKKALNSFQNLESLRIELTNLVVFKGETDPITPIKLPNSLKYIDWQYCTVSLCYMQEDPQSINYNYNTSLSAHNVFRFQPDYFPKLKKFSSYLLPITFNNEFLTHNPHLTYLNFKIEEFNKITSIFGLIQNISKLELKVDYLDLDLDAISLNLPKLRYLGFYEVNYGTWPILKKLLLSSPNLTELSIIHPVYTSPPLFELINNIQRLQKLTIESNNALSMDCFIPNQSLKFLELFFKSDIHLILEKLTNCTNFKVVSFKKNFFDNNYLENLNQLTNQNWRLIDIGNFLKYYRLN